jgi:MFS transporter, DHA2 family, multidrug resistance protein
MNVILVHKNAANDNYLLMHTNIYNEPFQDRINLLTQAFSSQGYFIDDARQLAYKMTKMMVFKQQSLVSYDNIFWIVALSVLVCIPIILLIRNDKGAAAAPVDVHLE